MKKLLFLIVLLAIVEAATAQPWFPYGYNSPSYKGLQIRNPKVKTSPDSMYVKGDSGQVAIAAIVSGGSPATAAANEIVYGTGSGITSNSQFKFTPYTVPRVLQIGGGGYFGSRTGFDALFEIGAGSFVNSAGSSWVTNTTSTSSVIMAGYNGDFTISADKSLTANSAFTPTTRFSIDGSTGLPRFHALTGGTTQMVTASTNGTLGVTAIPASQWTTVSTDIYRNSKVTIGQSTIGDSGLYVNGSAHLTNGLLVDGFIRNPKIWIGTPSPGTMFYWQADGSLALISGTTTGQYLQVIAGLPGFGSLIVDLSSQATGNLPVARLNGGTSASSSTWWNGTGAWTTPTFENVLSSPNIGSNHTSAFGANDWTLTQNSTGRFKLSGIKQTGSYAKFLAHANDSSIIAVSGTGVIADAGYATGAYTPTLTGTANVELITTHDLFYAVQNNIVQIHGIIEVNTVASGNALTTLTITPPPGYSTTLNGDYGAGNGAAVGTSVSNSAQAQIISLNATANHEMRFLSSGTGNFVFSINFSYYLPAL